MNQLFRENSLEKSRVFVLDLIQAVSKNFIFDIDSKFCLENSKLLKTQNDDKNTNTISVNNLNFNFFVISIKRYLYQRIMKLKLNFSKQTILKISRKLNLIYFLMKN